MYLVSLGFKVKISIPFLRLNLGQSILYPHHFTSIIAAFLSFHCCMVKYYAAVVNYFSCTSTQIPSPPTSPTSPALLPTSFIILPSSLATLLPSPESCTGSFASRPTSPAIPIPSRRLSIPSRTNSPTSRTGSDPCFKVLKQPSDLPKVPLHLFRLLGQLCRERIQLAVRKEHPFRLLGQTFYGVGNNIFPCTLPIISIFSSTAIFLFSLPLSGDAFNLYFFNLLLYIRV